MPFYLDNFKDNPHFKFNKDYKIRGLESFKNDLERHFFAKAGVCNYISDKNESLLAIELNCNLALVELLFYFNRGDWGKDGFLSTHLRDLAKINGVTVDIDELSIHLKDTSIVVNRIYNQSIAQQFENILTEIAHHYVHFTKGLSEVPYEIFVPVFEETNLETNTSFLNMAHGNNTRNDYFRYWGAYYLSQNDPSIYDLDSLSLISGDLYMLNH
ncbi:hypothetical protein [Ulvibacterium marinum]|uniref:hypothetical protein n=1 Tax=Ulvibacterium marinum TaxID=2419782 RepID=UPI0024949A48|nr:hypothetical protein [Ulvibacterium marinum]